MRAKFECAALTPLWNIEYRALLRSGTRHGHPATMESDVPHIFELNEDMRKFDKSKLRFPAQNQVRGGRGVDLLLFRLLPLEK